MATACLRGAFVLVLVLPTTALSQLSDADALQLMKERDLENASAVPATAPGRGSTATPPPWLVSTPTALFDRPTLSEAFKVAAATTDKGEEYSVAIGPTSFFGYSTWATEGLQVHAAYNIQAEVLSFGGKWSLDWRDARKLPASNYVKIDAKRKAVFDDCIKPDLSNLAECQSKELEAIYSGLNARAAPATSIAVSGQRDFKSGVWGEFTVSGAVSYTYQVPDPLWSLNVNADYRQAAPTVGRTRNWTAGLEGIYYFTVLKAPVQLGIGAKFVQCFDNCTSDKASVLFGPSLGLTLAKNTQLGASLSWEGKGGNVKSAFSSLALSYSFDSPFGKK